MDGESGTSGRGTGDEWIVPGYTETRELGAGASGRVVLAVHDATGTPVAIKYLNERYRANETFRTAFRREAETLGALGSPHVAALYEYVEAPRAAAIVMELIDGVTLRTLIREHGPTAPEAALVLLKGSLLGLAAAHTAGVVHRDYKPGNVLVALDGTSKLVDFGIAVPSGFGGTVAGTPRYMAPEQWRGLPTSPATDIYAATATFHECLTGRPPFGGDSTTELMVQHTTAPIPLENVPPGVRGLIQHGMAKDPALRPADATAFLAELEEAATAGYGADWEEGGRRALAALAALLPLLLPRHDMGPGGTTAEAETVLSRPEPSPTAPPAPTGPPLYTPPPVPSPAAPPPGTPLGGAPWRRLVPVGSALLIALLVVLATGLPAQGEKGTVAETAATSSPGPATEDAEPPAPTPEPTETGSSPEPTDEPTAEPTPAAGPTDPVPTPDPTDPVGPTDEPTDPPVTDPCEGITGIRTIDIPRMVYSGESVYTGDVVVTTCTTEEVGVWVEWYAVDEETGETITLEEGSVVYLSAAREYMFTRETINDAYPCYTTVFEVSDDADGDPYAVAEAGGSCDLR